MDIDPDISNWILDYLLRRPLELHTLSHLLRNLPLPNDNHNLKKLILLRRLEDDVSTNSISENTLQLLEQLLQIELELELQQQGASDSMRLAYCSVAVEITVRHLLDRDCGEEVGKFRFFEAVKRVWRGRIGRMEGELEKGLCSEELRGWKDEIEAAVWEDGMCEVVVRRSKGVDAREALRGYLREERERMGPSFLELVAERAKEDEGLRRVMLGARGRVAVGDATSAGTGWDNDAGDVKKEMQKEKSKPRNRVVCTKRYRGMSGNSRGAKINDSEELEGPLDGDYNLPSSADVKRVREALESSSLRLQAVVKDPLPDALQYAETISAMAREDKGENPREENRNETHMHIVDGAGVVQAKSNITNGHRPSLMERNSTAQTFEWKESIDRSHEDSGGSRGRIHLPSPRTVNVSPLNIHEMISLKKRRKKRKWSLLEEDTLSTAVGKYGKGNWKFILNAHRDTFEGRTEVDLKDKWRNMTR